MNRNKIISALSNIIDTHLSFSDPYFFPEDYKKVDNIFEVVKGKFLAEYGTQQEWDKVVKEAFEQSSFYL